MKSRTIDYKYVIVFAIIILSSCGMKPSLDEAQNVSFQFVQNIIDGKYEEALSKINWNQEPLVKDSVLNYFDILRFHAQSEFGKNPKYKSLGCQQNIVLGSTDYAKTEIVVGKSGMKTCLVQISDKHHFSLFKLNLDKDNKILFVDMSNDIYPIPDSTLFWTIGLIAMLLVFSFNIFVFLKVYKSEVTRKWLKYLIIILLNFPLVGFNLIQGFYFKLFSLSIIGVGFSVSNYLNSYWAIGIPLGAIIVFWRIRNNLYRTKEDDLFYVEAANI